MDLSPIAALLLTLFAAAGSEDVTFPGRPPSTQSLADDAGVIADWERSRVREICRSLETEMKAPLRVVTIRSMADYGAAGWPIERFAYHLFEAWDVGSVGHAENGGWDRGMLLLVSLEDREACVELGPDWLGHHHRRSRQIVENLVLPEFRAGRLSEGILLGVSALDALARNLEVPRRELSAMEILGMVSLAGFLLAAFLSLLLRGSSGWTCGFVRLVIRKPFELAEPANDTAARAELLEPRLSEHGGASGTW
jgi:uncharacterized protein